MDSNYMLRKVWDEITHPFPNFNGCTVEVLEWITNSIPHFIMDVITYQASLKLNHASKKGPCFTNMWWYDNGSIVSIQTKTSLEIDSVY